MPWWCSGQGCGAQRLRSENRYLAWAPCPLNNLKVSWLKSERKGLDKIEKSRLCSGSGGGARSLKGEDRFPAGSRSLLRWFQSGRNRLGRMKSAAAQQLARWCNGQRCGVRSHGGEDRFSAAPRARLSWFQCGETDQEVVTVLRNLTSS